MDVIKGTESHQVFRNLSEDDPEIIEIESMCAQCRENGTTRMLLTKIPFYKEVVVISFTCLHCGWENNELQPASTIQDQGVEYQLKVISIKDLQRQIVKTDWASIEIKSIEFEIPSRSQAGVITTIEGIFQRALTGISHKEESLKDSKPKVSEQLSSFLKRLQRLLSVEEPFTLTLRDITGNSFIENSHAPQKDPEMIITHFERTMEENKLLGLAQEEKEDLEEVESELKLDEEVLSFDCNCPSCNAPCQTLMKVTKIPHFKEVIIMATNCSSCGHRTNEVKSGSGIESQGTRYVLRMKDIRDLTRDVLKSETCSIEIPELELDVGSGALGGRFTTVEGLLDNIKEQLKTQNPLTQGDSVTEEIKEQMNDFLKKIDEIIAGKQQITFILDDPCGNSYLQKFEDEDDQLEVTQYERTFDQNEELGLNDIKVENY